MNLQKPLHISSQGGSIICLEGVTGRIFQTCLANHCTYSRNLHSAKANLDFLESKNNKLLQAGQKTTNIPAQRKTTLKWNADGSLSSIDMTRILNRLDKYHLTACELTCKWNY